jgi:hypothetical protein
MHLTGIYSLLQTAVRTYVRVNTYVQKLGGIINARIKCIKADAQNDIKATI